MCLSSPEKIELLVSVCRGKSEAEIDTLVLSNKHLCKYFTDSRILQ